MLKHKIKALDRQLDAIYGAARLREIADAESGAPSPPLGPYRKKPRHDDTGPATPAIPEVA